MTLKTSTKIVVYTNKCICQGNIWWVFISRVNTRANIIWQSDLVKIHWQILFNNFLCSWTQILCYSFFGKYSLPKKHCLWELSFTGYVCDHHTRTDKVYKIWESFLKVLEKSMIYSIDNSNGKLEMTVEMLLKYLLGNPNSIHVWPGAVARSEASSLGMQAVPSSIPTCVTFFRGDLVMKTFLRPFSRWFKKSSCQLLAKECALSTGKLPKRLVQEQCARLTDCARNDLKCVEGS